MPNTKLALYFGSYEGDGHYIYRSPDAPWRTELHGKDIDPDFPWDIGLLDSGLLRNRGATEIDGTVHWTCGGKSDLWFAFFWWDRSMDSRPGSNSGFYVRGFGPAGEAHANVEHAFQYTCETWPKVVKRCGVLDLDILGRPGR